MTDCDLLAITALPTYSAPSSPRSLHPSLRENRTPIYSKRVIALVTCLYTALTIVRVQHGPYAKGEKPPSQWRHRLAYANTQPY